MDVQTAPQMVMTSQSPSINIGDTNKESIIKVVFNLDPHVVDWILNTFYDSHLEALEEKQMPVSVPNAEVYRCPKCNIDKKRELGPIKQYLFCSGTELSKHDKMYTVPVDWKPILSQAGLYYILGQVNASMNTNIATANFGKSENDVKNHASLEDRLKYNAFYLAFTMLSVIESGYKLYCSKWIDIEKKLHVVFSIGFDTNFLIHMTNNILSNFTKGKNMETLGKVLENKVSTETSATHHIDSPLGGQNKAKSTKEELAEMFHFR